MYTNNILALIRETNKDKQHKTNNSNTHKKVKTEKQNIKTKHTKVKHKEHPKIQAGSIET